MTNEDAALVRAWLDDDTAPCPTSVRLAEFAYRYCDRDPIAWLAAIAVGRHMCLEGSHEASADLLAENERLRLRLKNALTMLEHSTRATEMTLKKLENK